jgi:porphobilinogen deaminase
MTIATRRSPLALWQANTVKALLENHGYTVELNLVVTSGDKMQRGALAEISLDDPNLPAHLKTGKGLFVKEVQEEILSGRADLAVHSMKDLPVETTDGLCISAVLPRANPSDVVIFSPQLLSFLQAKANIKTNDALDSNTSSIVDALRTMSWSSAAPIGTTSARRQHFLKTLFAPSTLPLVVLRGNVDTRLGRVANNEFSFIMLARAGIDRLGLFQPEKMLTLPPTLSVPAPAQGVVAIECRENDFELNECLAKIGNPQASLQAACERTALWLTGGNCHTALAAHFSGANLKIWAAKDSIQKDLDFSFSPEEVQKLQAQANTARHSDLFKALIASPAAKRMHADLRSQDFQQLMSLREPS